MGYGGDKNRCSYGEYEGNGVKNNVNDFNPKNDFDVFSNVGENFVEFWGVRGGKAEEDVSLEEVVGDHRLDGEDVGHEERRLDEDDKKGNQGHKPSILGEDF